MRMTKSEKNERETHGFFYEDDEYWIFESTSGEMIRKFRDLKYEVLKENKDADGNVIRVEYKIPIDCIQFYSKRQAKKLLADK